MNQAETEAALNIVNNNTNIKVETDNVYNNHPLNQLDKKNSVETLSNEESTGHSTNDSDRERYSLNNNKNKLVDFSMTQPYIPLNMSYEYSTRKILIPDAGDFSLKTNFKDRSLRSSKINSFTPRKNNQTINENNLISQNIRKLFRHDKNSFTTEKNKFNKFSHYQSHSPVNLKNSYSLIKNKDVIGNLNNSNLNNTIIRKNSSKYYEAPEAEKILKNLSHSCSIENNANTRTIDYNCLFEGNYNKSNLNVQSFNLLNHNANTANISLLSDTSSVSDNENKVLITVRIKTDAKTTKEVSIKKNQNIFTAAKNFCEENKMSPLLINSISHTIHKAISSINDIFNLSLCESNQNCLTDLHDLYSPSSSSEETEFNLKNQNCRYNNFSCITLLNSDDEDEFDKNNLLNENDLNWLNVTM